jgi:UDP-N-acetylglucosamine 4,6-dehydratase/5-epimerase
MYTDKTILWKDVNEKQQVVLFGGTVMNSFFKDKIILCTGNGSFANAMIERLLKTDVKEIRIYSRNEEKQVLSERKYEDTKLKFILGDIRDYKTLYQALKGVDYCIHTAALKHVKKCEENPLECFSINIDGTKNVINACIENKVQKLCCLSTDKAANACTTYGVSKYAGERIIVGVENKDTTITMTRYGNVAGSSGSVIPYFKQLASEGKPLTLTDPNMTRFYIPIEKAVDSVIYALEHGNHKDLIVYKSKSATVQQIADCISDNQVVVGIIKSEKTDEALLTERELNHCYEDGDFFIYNEDNLVNEIECQNLDGTKYNVKKYDKPLTSDNAERYTQEELKELINRC